MGSNNVQDIFKNKIFYIDKLLDFGFKPDGEWYKYTVPVMENQFTLTVRVKAPKEILTELIDNTSGELYTLHLLEAASGTFIGNVREEYEKVLNLIANACCKNTYFVSAQANRLTELIKQKYNDYPEFLWEKFPGYGVFRNPRTEKWYGLIANIDKSKLDKRMHGEVEILDIKLEQSEIEQLIHFAGFYPAYHMNKKSWIAIILDETLKDEVIMDLVDKSHSLSLHKK